MSKRYGNFVTARGLRMDGVDPAAIRLLLYQTHYRHPLDLTDEALAQVGEGAQRLGEMGRRLASGEEGRGSEGGEVRTGVPRLVELAARTDREFKAALDDDLNAPKAVAAVFEFVRQANRLMDAGEPPDPETRAAWNRWTEAVLDVLPVERTAGADMAAWVETRLAERAAARKRRDYAKADAIRAELGERGIIVEDIPGGTKWRVEEGEGAGGG